MRTVIGVLGALALAAGSAAAGERPKVVILGFDGADARLVETWMQQGELPHLARLRDEGAFAPLEPTNPAQTPVSWSSFATGTDPGKTQIFDWLNRDPSNYLPDFVMVSATKRTLLFGERNGPVLGSAAAIVILLATLAVLWWTPLTRRTRWLAALVVAALGGVPVGLAAARLLPVEVPDARNNRKGRTMWETAEAAGLSTLVVRVPATFPAEPLERGHMVSGLGVPDMRGGIGTPAFYASDPLVDLGDNEFSLALVRLSARRGRIQTNLIGPYNKPFYDYVVERRVAAAPPEEREEVRRRARRELDDARVPRRLDLPLTLEITETSCTLDVAGVSRTLRVGEWSDWVELRFPVNPLVDLAAPLVGMTRFKLLALEPEVLLYQAPINFHPDCHPVAFSWPPSYSEALAKRFGLYKTIGWSEDTWSLAAGMGDEELFLEDSRFTVDKYEEIMKGLLGDGGVDLYVQIFYFTDRIGHLFWQFLDTGHPRHDPVKAARYAPEMLLAYKRMDDLVGEARALAGDEAVFIVCSDHGFSSFRRGVNYNNWLVDQGLMTLKNRPGKAATLEKLFDTRDLFTDVDWSRTKAYALGLGSIYINLAGREQHGIVLPGPEYDALLQQIRTGLESLVDPVTGRHPVTRVWTREELYGEFDPNRIPDLRVGNALDYRVSWQTTLGGFGSGVLEDNHKAWSGDHCSSDPAVVPGILFINRPFDTSHPRMVDVMPTVLKLLGLEPPAGLDGRPLL